MENTTADEIDRIITGLGRGEVEAQGKAMDLLGQMKIARATPSAGDVEAVAQAIAGAAHSDLSVAIHEAGGITKAIEVFGMTGGSDDPRYKDWRIPSCRGIILMANAAIAARPAAMPDVVEAADALNKLIERGQMLTRMYLEPCERRIQTEKQYASAMIELMDGPQQRDAQSKHRAAISPTDAQDGWNSDMEAAPPEVELQVYRKDACVFTAFYIEADGGDWYWCSANGEDLANDMPTHWRTLSAPPTDAQGDRT